MKRTHDGLPWRLEVIEQLADRAFELHVKGEYQETERTLNCLSAFVADCRVVLPE